MSITNPQQANEALQASELSVENRREAQREHTITQAELERRRDERKADETVTVRIEGAPVEFKPAPAHVEHQTIELARESEAFDVDDPDEIDDFETRGQLADLMLSTFPEYSHDPELPPAFFEEYQLIEVRGFFEDWVQATNSEDRIRSFRNE